MKIDDSHLPPEDVCGTSYAAKLLGLSVGTVQSLVERNELRAWKTRGGHRRISMASIQEYQRRHQSAVVPAPEAPRHRLKVLIVEDDEIGREMLKAQFAQWDLPIDFTATASALDALIDIMSLQPDVLITDLKMPGVDGFELLRTLRNNPALSRLHLLALTGLSPDEVQARGGLPERTAYLRKPLDMAWLKGYFTALLSERQAA